MFEFSLNSTEPDSIAHIIQVALAPAFLLSALATLLTRLIHEGGGSKLASVA